MSDRPWSIQTDLAIAGFQNLMQAERLAARRRIELTVRTLAIPADERAIYFTETEKIRERYENG